MKRVIDIMNGCEENHLLPFFWQHGEDEKVLREYMEKIQASGIHAVCVEARPHPEFVGEGWWRDMDIIIDEAKKRDMKVWILDDSHFPTGCANGMIKEKYPQYRKRFLKLHQLDFAGPCKYAQAIIKYAFTDEEDQLEGIYLAKKTGYETIDALTIIDITENVHDKSYVSFELPEGEWKLLVLVSTYEGGEPHTEGYLNPIVPEAVDVLIETVYETHYSHYRNEFGKTILGFFSDEPRFGNMHGSEGSIGRFPMVLPWREDLDIIIQERMEKSGLNVDNIRSRLPLLWVDSAEAAPQIRFFYMDVVSELYAECFSQRIGAWCEKHGVDYIGHVIEDNNASARLGYGAGHFFKSMRGQHMAGIDVVLHQLMPGMDHCKNKAMTARGWDGEFFHYVLGKLGASLGHIDPKKKGRVMCEVYGAYGWAEGNRLMKWITDHMLVRGVNKFVPHAFSPLGFPDADCPPHFYAHGKNPQFPGFKQLMTYMNRMAHLLSGGVHHAPVAVGYHGEAEWSGDYMLVQKPCAYLARNQIDYDILPQQAIVEAKININSFTVHKEDFRALVIPYAEAQPIAYMEKMIELAKAGIKVYILDALPIRSSEGIDVVDLLEKIQECKNIEVVKLEQMVETLWEAGIYEIKSSSEVPYLRYYRYEQEDGEVLMFVNEAPAGTIKTQITVPFSGTAYRYDAFENNFTKVDIKNGILDISLEAFESAVYLWPKEGFLENVTEEKSVKKQRCLNRPWKVSFTTQEMYPYFDDEMLLEKLVPMQMVAGKENFAGIIRYETTFDLEEQRPISIVLDTVYEDARVSVNDCPKKVRICPPYRFDISDVVKKGENKLVIEVTTTLVREQMDWLSQFVLLEPIGITDNVWLAW